MTTEVQAATLLYSQLKPKALGAYRDYILKRTPANLQEEMPAVIDTDISNSASAAVAPVVVDPPYISQTGTGVGSTLACTLGNWNGTPTSRTYQWKRGATNVGTNSPSYTVVAGDIGQTMTCVMTATNGSGTSPPTISNPITVT